MIDQEVLKRLEKLESQMSSLEKKVERKAPLAPNPQVHKEETKEEVEVSRRETESESPGFNFTSTQALTFLGVIGVIIGIISFFFYAVAQSWIGELGQVFIGVVVGFFFFALAYKLRVKNTQWSDILFGASFIIEFLSIGVGVQVYNIIPVSFALLLLVLFVGSSFYLSMFFSSRVISYLSLFGGFFIPFLTNTLDVPLFLVIFYLLLSVSFIFLSLKKNWDELRLVSFVTLAIMVIYFILEEGHSVDPFLMLIFVGLSTLLYNFAPYFVKRQEDKELVMLDVFVLIGTPLLFLIAYSSLYVFEAFELGLVLAGFTLLYVFQGALYKFKQEEISSLSITSFTGTYLLFNLAVIFLSKDFLLDDFFFVFFLLETLFLSFLSSKVKEEKQLSFVLSGVSAMLALLIYTYFLRFDEGVGHASLFLFVLITGTLFFYGLYKMEINALFSKAAAFILGFLTIFSFSKYLLFFNESEELREVVLSVLWLVYTLFFFSKAQDDNSRILVGLFLGGVLVKIAFVDLFFLEGAFRIVGFIIFGILLILGGYFLKGSQETAKID